MTAQPATNRLLAVEIAAQRLGVEPAAVRLFIRQQFLRMASQDPPTVWESDVERLQRVLARHLTAASAPGPASTYLRR